MARRGLLLLAALGFFLTIVGSAQASSPSARQIDGLFWAITWFALGVSVIVYGGLFYFLWRYRQGASPARPGGGETHEGNKRVETIWTIFPVVILVIITLLSFPVLMFTDTMPPADVRIHVTGNRFSWTFAYEEPGVAPENWTRTVGEAWFQRGIVVHFIVNSTDVIHSFALPQLGVRIDAIPHHYNTAWTRVDVAGDYLTQCAEFCGVGHHGMRATIHVFNPEPGRKPYGPPPASLPFTTVELRGFGSPPWSIVPREINATNNETLRLLIVNNNPENYTFRVDSPIGQAISVPAFSSAWLNFTVSVASDETVSYGPTNATARGFGLNGTMNVTTAITIILNEYSVDPDPHKLDVGRPVRFLLRNVGSQAHNFRMGGVYGDVIYTAPILAGQSVVIGPFNFTQDATDVYWCDIPGHRALGMEAPYQVGAGSALVSGDVPLYEMTITTFAIGVPVTVAYVVRHARRRDE
jgi:cytochrome c oxidase subunit 2